MRWVKAAHEQRTPTARRTSSWRLIARTSWCRSSDVWKSSTGRPLSNTMAQPNRTSRGEIMGKLMSFSETTVELSACSLGSRFSLLTFGVWLKRSTVCSRALAQPRRASNESSQSTRRWCTRPSSTCDVFSPCGRRVAWPPTASTS